MRNNINVHLSGAKLVAEASVIPIEGKADSVFLAFYTRDEHTGVREPGEVTLFFSSLEQVSALQRGINQVWQAMQGRRAELDAVPAVETVGI